MAGRGRGRENTLPAWMTQGASQSSMHDGMLTERRRSPCPVRCRHREHSRPWRGGRNNRSSTGAPLPPPPPSFLRACSLRAPGQSLTGSGRWKQVSGGSAAPWSAAAPGSLPGPPAQRQAPQQVQTNHVPSAAHTCVQIACRHAERTRASCGWLVLRPLPYDVWNVHTAPIAFAHAARQICCEYPLSIMVLESQHRDGLAAEIPTAKADQHAL